MSSDEQFWCEITDRSDIGADLKCPQSDESGKPYWSYRLIHDVRAGEIVFHYSTRSREFVGASVAGAPLEDRPTVWAPHGTVGRAKHEERSPRPGWWLPLHCYTKAPSPLSLRELNEPQEQAWVRAWLLERGSGTKAPVQAYPGALRGAQGYLTKMPVDWVERWAKLRDLADSLATVQDDLSALSSAPVVTPIVGDPLTFKPKSADEYVVELRARKVVRTRHHEKLVREVAERLSAAGATVANPHPIDLLMTEPRIIIFEAKTVGSRDPSYAIREAVGQVLEYRHYLGPKDASVCILLDAEPASHLISYVEDTLGMLIAWAVAGTFRAGPRTAELVPETRSARL